MNEIVVASTATGISITGRLIFMYLLYTKKSTNIYSLIFSILNIVSSSLWIKYSEMVKDKALLIRGSSDIILFTISGIYIIYNRIELYKISSSSSSRVGIELEEVK
jgi:hypothetical protein